MYRHQTTAFAIVTVWDWIATATTRLVVVQSDWAVALAAVITVFWFYGTKAALDAKTRMWVVVVASALGTWLGMKVP